MRRLLIVALALAPASCVRQDAVREPVVGQWVWSRDDATLLTEGRAERARLRSAVWIGTLLRDGHGVRTQLGISPAMVDDAATTLVIRLDDSLHPLVDSLSTPALALALGDRVSALLHAAGATGGHATLQLDYDAPVRLLPRWAAVLRVLRGSRLHDRPVWITSLLVHVEQRDYGRWFGGGIDGHVLQLFDTQVEYTDAMQRKVERVVASAGLPCAIGVGAFERVLAGGARTEHRAWLPWAARAMREGRVDALWIFAANRPYHAMLSSVGL
ncbi:MAG: hypothetical protein H7066_11675 [Cytophagaceae bacterium]|nr:hypothetical protein [Gemmatimonadaceae bacterium]